MKILYIDPQSGNNLALYDYNLLKSIDADITYCCSIIYDAPVVDNIRYKYVFKYNRLSNNFLKAFSYLMSLILVLCIAIRTKPDVIHIQWWRLWILDYIFLAFFKKCCKTIVYTAHNLVPHESGNSKDRQCQLYYRHVDKIIVHAERTKYELVERFEISKDKISVIPHGILAKEVNPNRDKIIAELKRKYKLNGKIIISAIGQQSSYKGTDIILDAYRESFILQNSKRFVFIIAGKGNIVKKEMTNSYPNLVIYDEFLPTEILDAIYDISDIILLPYRIISQSGVLLTAVAKEIPYIATDVGGLLEPLAIAPIAWRLSENSPAELSKLLEALENNPQEILKKKRNPDGWKKVKNYYSWETIGSKTLECYNSSVL